MIPLCQVRIYMHLMQNIPWDIFKISYRTRKFQNDATFCLCTCGEIVRVHSRWFAYDTNTVRPSLASAAPDRPLQHFLYEPDVGEAATQAHRRAHAAVRPLYEALDRVLGRPAGLTGERRRENHFGLRGSRAPPPPGPADGDASSSVLAAGGGGAAGDTVERQAEQLLGSLRCVETVYRGVH